MDLETKGTLSVTEFIQSELNAARELNVKGGLDNWADARNRLTEVLAEITLLQISVLSERGLSGRMTYNYTEAEQDFTQAVSLANLVKDPERELIATVGLIDLYRTGDRDKNFVPGKDLERAKFFKGKAQILIDQMSDPTVASIKANNQFGLLAQEEDSLEEADTYYAKAQEGAEILVAKLSTPETQNLLARAYTTRGVTILRLGRIDEALAVQEKAYEQYKILNDTRGRGNAASAAGGIYTQKGEVDKAKEWYQKAIEASTQDGKVIDPEIYDSATEAIKDLSASS